MRYRKGTIALNEDQDIELIGQVLHAGFIRHGQLAELLRLRRAEKIPQSFAWRVRRLVAHGLLSEHRVKAVGDEPVYSATGAAIEALAHHGRFYVEPLHRLGRRGGIMHALELADIQLALLRAGVLALWMSELEIRSRNRLRIGAFAKDYDALVDVFVDGGTASFALEYECTLKNTQRYETVRAAIASERGVETFLYLTPNYHLLTWVARMFTGIRQRVYFATAGTFKRDVLETEITDACQSQSFRLAAALSPLRHIVLPRN
jgi:hypothetical protein